MSNISTEPDAAATRGLTRDLLGSRSWILILAVVGVGALARLWSFDRMWINPDEGIYFSMVTWISWESFWSECVANAHPPLYYLLLRAVSVVAVDVTLLRGVSLVFGIGWLVAMYLFARECAGRGPVATLTGLLAASLIAVSDTAIEMSQLMRPYATQLATLTLALYYLVRYIRDSSRRGLPAYAAWMIFALLTHYATLLVLAGVAVACVGLLAARALDGKQIRALLIWNIPVFVVSALCYGLHIRPSLEGSEIALGAVETWLEAFMMDDLVEVWPRFLGVFKCHIQPTFEGPVALVFLVGIGIAIYRKNVFLAASTLATLGIAVLASFAHKYPFGESRHSIYLLVVVVPPTAYAVATVLTNGWRLAIPAMVVMTGLTWFHAPVTTWMGSVDLVRVRESALQRSHMEVARTFIRREVESPGIVIMSMQTYFVLMPDLHLERNATEFSPDRTIGWFRWGKRTAVVLQAWTFRASRETIGDHDHLHTFIRNIERQLPELELRRRRKVLLLLGEWSEIMPLIREFKQGPPGARALIGLSSFVPGFAALEFDAIGYSEIVDRGLKRGK